MIISIIGIENKLELNSGFISLLNIHNVILYRQIIKFLLNDINDKTKNTFVILDELERISSKELCFVNDLYNYTFDNKSLIDKIVKPYVLSLNSHITDKENETKLYYNLTAPLIEFINTLEVDYDIKEELDISFYSKILGIDFSLNDSETEINKVLAIIKLESKLLNKKIFIFNGLIRLLTKDEQKELEEYVKENSLYLLLIDYIEENVVVNMNMLYIDDDFGSYNRIYNSI